MAGLLLSYGVMVGLALALVMAPLAWGAAGAEHGSPGSDVAPNFAENYMHSTWTRDEMEACILSNNPIRMHTDGLKDTAAPVLDRGAVPERRDDTNSRPQPKAEEKSAGMAMPRIELAAAPADGPSPSGSTGLAVSGLMCVGMVLLCLVMA